MGARFRWAIALAGIVGPVIAPRTLPAAVSVAIGSASGAPGETVTISARLRSEGELVAGVQVDVAFDPRVAVASTDRGTPDCEVNAGIDKQATAFAFEPAGCGRAGRACAGIRALVFALDNTAPIPSGADLFTCRVAIAAHAAPGSVSLSGRRALYAPPEGGDHPAQVDPGMVTVEGTGPVTEVPRTPTAAPATRTATAAPTAPTVAGGGGGGCRMRGDGNGVGLGVLGVFAAVLALRRRRGERLRSPWRD